MMKRMAQRVTLRDVANACGVSVNAVSLALRNHPRISADTRGRIQKQAEALGYLPDGVLSAGMSRLRRRGGSPGAVLAVVDGPRMAANQQDDSHALRRAGLERRARELGFEIAFFHPAEDGTGWKRLRQVLEARGIYGVILMVWPPNEAEFLELARAFPICSFAIRSGEVGIATTGTDHYTAGHQATLNVLALGYRRPGLVIASRLDAIFENRTVGGFLAATHALPRTRQIPVLSLKEPRRASYAEAGRRWSERYRPDVVLTNHHFDTPAAMRCACGLQETCAVVRTNLPKPMGEWAGMVYALERVGAAAVDMVVGQLHRGERGPQPDQSYFLVEPGWMDGSSCPPACDGNFRRSKMTRRPSKID